MAATAQPVNPVIDFTFEEEGHRYFDKAKQPILSVTQTLDSVGITDYPDIAQVQAAMEWKSGLGTAVHAATQFIDSSAEGELDWNTLDPRAVGYVMGYEKFCEEACFTAQHVELRGAVQLPQGRVGFTLDRIGSLGGLSAIVELKTTLNIEKSVAIQTAAYEDCVLALGYKPEGSPTFKRLAVQLRENGTYKLHIYSDPVDKNVWRWCLSLATWKQNHGYKLGAA